MALVRLIDPIGGAHDKKSSCKCTVPREFQDQSSRERRNTRPSAPYADVGRASPVGMHGRSRAPSRAYYPTLFWRSCPLRRDFNYQDRQEVVGKFEAVLSEINSLDWRAWRVGKTANRFLKFWRSCPIAGGLARWLSAEPPCPSDAPFRCLDCWELFFRALDRPPGMPVCLSRFLQFVDRHRPIGQGSRPRAPRSAQAQG